MEYGKFADAAQLGKAYALLEKEFTKKCQELAKAKKAVEELKRERSGAFCGDLDGEKTKANAARNNETRTEDESFDTNGGLRNAAEGTAERGDGADWGENFEGRFLHGRIYGETHAFWSNGGAERETGENRLLGGNLENIAPVTSTNEEKAAAEINCPLETGGNAEDYLSLNGGGKNKISNAVRGEKVGRGADGLENEKPAERNAENGIAPQKQGERAAEKSSDFGGSAADAAEAGGKYPTGESGGSPADCRRNGTGSRLLKENKEAIWAEICVSGMDCEKTAAAFCSDGGDCEKAGPTEFYGIEMVSGANGETRLPDRGFVNVQHTPKNNERTAEELNGLFKTGRGKGENNYIHLSGGTKSEISSWAVADTAAAVESDGTESGGAKTQEKGAEEFGGGNDERGGARFGTSGAAAIGNDCRIAPPKGGEGRNPEMNFRFGGKDSALPAASDTRGLSEFVENNPLIADKIFEIYLTKQSALRAPVLLGGGGCMPAAPENKPKNISEASKMSRNIFK